MTHQIEQNAGQCRINTMEINTKLLVADGDIVVIGGIKKNTVGDNKSKFQVYQMFQL